MTDEPKNKYEGWDKVVAGYQRDEPKPIKIPWYLKFLWWLTGRGKDGATK